MADRISVRFAAGIAVAAGHTTAGLPEMQLAVAHGVRQVTHCFNGMQGFGHRDLGTVEARWLCRKMVS